jgi:hypothetical protein
MKNTVVEIDAERGSLVAQEDGTSLHFVLLVPEVQRFQLGDAISGDLRFLASMGSGVISHAQGQCLVVCPKGTCSRDTALGALTKH